MNNQYMVSFGDAVKRAFSKYCQFTGRASRSEFWWFYLFNLIISSIIFIACGGTGVISHAWQVAAHGGSTVGVMFSGLYGTINTIWSLVILLPSLGLFWRRLHDGGHSGWWWLIGLIPFVGTIVLLVFLCQGSQPMENKYGAVPNVA
ncbi:MAG: DUF805 domain-containing protein [Muribaculaceae bacterium]|nr:DUF805 domain-containing protein [Muribaculaceae bacterium]